jgi:hypothetical protein
VRSWVRGAFGDVENIELATSRGFGGGLFVWVMNRFEAVNVKVVPIPRPAFDHSAGELEGSLPFAGP